MLGGIDRRQRLEVVCMCVRHLLQGDGISSTSQNIGGDFRHARRVEQHILLIMRHDRRGLSFGHGHMPRCHLPGGQPKPKGKPCPNERPKPCTHQKAQRYAQGQNPCRIEPKHPKRDQGRVHSAQKAKAPDKRRAKADPTANVDNSIPHSACLHQPDERENGPRPCCVISCNLPPVPPP